MVETKGHQEGAWRRPVQITIYAKIEEKREGSSESDDFLAGIAIKKRCKGLPGRGA